MKSPADPKSNPSDIQVEHAHTRTSKQPHAFHDWGNGTHNTSRKAVTTTGLLHNADGRFCVDMHIHAACTENLKQAVLGVISAVGALDELQMNNTRMESRLNVSLIH